LVAAGGRGTRWRCSITGVPLPSPARLLAPLETATAGVVATWLLEGFGVVALVGDDTGADAVLLAAIGDALLVVVAGTVAGAEAVDAEPLVLGGADVAVLCTGL